MAITTKRITMRQGNEADWKPEKMMSAEMAVIKDKKELHFAYEDGKTKRVATEDDISKLSGQISDLQQGGSGVTTAMSQSLWAIMQKTAFSEQLTDAELNAFKTAWGIESGGEVEPDLPDEPENPEVTLTSISATYTGGEVAVGTSVNALTGITVKAHYSDGTSKNVTGYTLSGTIAEGNNTITVSYGGKTTTFVVVGYVEQEEPDTTEPVYQLAQATTFDGTNHVDTGVVLDYINKDLTICVDWTPSAKSGYVFDASGDGTTYGIALRCINNWSWITLACTNTNAVSTTMSRQRLVITHEKNSLDFKHYWIEDSGSSITETLTSLSKVQDVVNMNSSANDLRLGAQAKDNKLSDYPYSGTINTFLIYERVLTSDEINAYMGV